MKTQSLQKPFFILQRFLPSKQVPSLSLSIPYHIQQKKLIQLKNIYLQQKCVMKIQPSTILQNKQRTILHQASFFQKFQGHIGIPLMIWSGQDFNCLVLITEQLGISIYNRMNQYCSQKRMRLKDVCMIGIQMIDIIKNLHEKQHLHRNITPEAFSFGIGEKITKLYMNDLLQVKKFIQKNTDVHVQEKQYNKLEYLTPFLSKNVLKLKQASRKDDLISIIYVLIYLLKGKLPWQDKWEEEISRKKQLCKQKTTNYIQNLVNLPIVNRNQKQFEFQMKQKVSKMLKIQQNITNQQLCRGLPKQIQDLLTMVSELQFSQAPQYQKYKAYLKKILFKKKLKNDFLFEWMQSQSSIQKHLRVSKHIINLQTDKTNEILSKIYTPFQSQVQIDLIANIDSQQKNNQQDNLMFKKINHQKNGFKNENKSNNLNYKTKNKQNCKII